VYVAGADAVVTGLVMARTASPVPEATDGVIVSGAVGLVPGPLNVRVAGAESLGSREGCPLVGADLGFPRTFSTICPAVLLIVLSISCGWGSVVFSGGAGVGRGRPRVRCRERGA